MNGKNIIAAIGIVLVFLVAGVIGVAMYLVDKDVLGVDIDYCRVLGGRRLANNDDERSKNKLRHVAMNNGMELRGHWKGMALAALGSQSAAKLGLAGVKDGAAVVHIDPNTGDRARQAGLQVGDVIVGIDGEQVDNLAELHAASRKTQLGTPTLVDVQRNGQSMTFVMPAQEQTMGMGMQVAAGPQFVCPQDGTLVPAAQVQATGQVCPLCRGPLHPMAASTVQFR